LTLLVLPLGYQLYTSTKLSPPAATQHAATEPMVEAAPKMAEAPEAERAVRPPSAPIAPAPSMANAQRDSQALTRSSIAPHTASQANLGASYDMAAPAPQLLPSDAAPSGDNFAGFDEQGLNI